MSKASKRMLSEGWFTAGTAIELAREVESLEQRITELEAERDAALAEVERLRGLLDRDRTGLAAGLNAVRDLIRGWSWLGAYEWGSYPWEDRTEETLRKECREFARQAHDVIARALSESGRRADAAFRPQLDARASEMKGDRGDAWCDRCLAAHEVGRLRAERDTAMDALREHDVTLDELRAVAFMNADADGVVVLCADGSVHRVPLERLAALKAMADAALKGGG